MRTKEEVIQFVREELTMNNSIIVTTMRNGGCGITILKGQDEESIEKVENELRSYDFDGVVDPSEDIACSRFLKEDSVIYQFSKGNDYLLQIIGYEV